MAAWADIEAMEPDFARRVRARFEAHRHSTMATLRKDGSPRISGTEVRFDGGDVVLGMMPGALKARDLRRDPRIAVHSHSEDPPEDIKEHDTWTGDAKLAGKAIEVPTDDPSHQFRIELTEVVLTRVGTPPDHLVIESWHEGKGYMRRERR